MTYIDNAVSVAQLNRAIADTPSKNEKDALLKLGMALPLFKRVVIAAYDPFKTYGLRTLPKVGVEGTLSLNDDTTAAWKVLDDLASRALSGDAAREAVYDTLMSLDAPSAYLFTRMVLKDMGAGYSEGSINRAAKGTIAEFPYMRCSLPAKSNMAKWDWSKGQVSQEKADGMFTNVDVDSAGQASLRTRQGQPIPAIQFSSLYLEVERVLNPNTQSHGEMLVYRDDKVLPREENNGYLNKLIQGHTLASNEQVRLHLWDQVTLGSVQAGKSNLPYRSRLRELMVQVRAGKSMLMEVVDTRIVKSKTEAVQHFRDMLAQGKEGTVCKEIDSAWKDGTSKDQVKFKLTAVVDLQIKAIVPGKDHSKNEGRAGSLTCVTACGKLQVDVTVKNEAMRDDVDANPHKWLEKIIKVVFNTIMTAEEEDELHSLFLPRMEEACFRLDKSVPDTFAQVQAQYQAAIEAA
jgi:DNA ligase-1